MSSLAAQTRLLLRNDLRLFWRDLYGAKKKLLLQLGLAALIFIPFQFGAYAALSHLKSFPPTYIEGMAWFFFLTLMIGGAMHQSIRVLYERSDLDLLLASPFNPSAILLSRLILVTVVAMASPVLFIFPLLNGLIFGFSARYLGGYVTWFLLGGLSATLGIALCLVLVRLIGARSARIVTQVFAATAGALFYLLFQIRAARDSAFFLHARDLAESVGNNPVSRLVVEAGRGQWLSLLALAVFSAAALWLAARLFGPSFIHSSQSTAERPQRRRNATTSRRRFASGLFLATFRKDTRLIFRDTLLLSRLLPSAMYIVPAFVGTLAAGGSITLRFAPFGFIIATQFSAQLVLVATAGEECWDLIRMSPASALRVRFAKLAAGMVAPLLLATGIALYLAYSGHPWVAVYMLLASIACSAACSWLEVATIKPTPRADLLRRHSGRKPIGRSIGQILLIIVGATSVSLLAYGAFWLGLFFFGLMLLGVIACFTFVELSDLPEN